MSRLTEGLDMTFIANTRGVCITVERLTNTLRHPNLMWNLVANFILSCLPFLILHHGKQVNN